MLMHGRHALNMEVKMKEILENFKKSQGHFRLNGI